MAPVIDRTYDPVALGTLRKHHDAGCLDDRYVPELDRIVLKESASARPFASTATCRKAVITTRILQLVHELCVKRIHVTKRDLFYTDVKLFEARLGLCRSREERTIATCSAMCLADPEGSCVKWFPNGGRRIKATRTRSWTTSPACWAAHAPASMVRPC